MTAILAHFRSLECRHRHKSRNCDEAQIAMRCGKEIRIAARLRRSACVRYPTGNVSGDPCLKSGTERANKSLFADVMRKNNFRHALEQVPFQIANASRCAMMAPLRVFLFRPGTTGPAATSVTQGLP
jgi:hypothetical protein